MQRTFTRSEYDHIGLVLKYKNGKAVIFEAVGNKLVLNTWETFLKNKWYKGYEK